MSSEILTTLIDLSDPRHPSNISCIREILAPLMLSSISVFPSLDSSRVIVQHTKLIPQSLIRETLENAGFNVDQIKGYPSIFESSNNGIMKEYDRGSDGRMEILNESFRDAKNLSEMVNIQVGQQNKSEFKINGDVIAANMEITTKSKSTTKENDLTPPQLVVVESPSKQSTDLWRASLAVFGMTCASCASCLKEALERKIWIKKITINPISNSVLVEFLGEDHIQKIVDTIKEAGFETAIDTIVQPFASTAATKNQPGQRIVEVLVDTRVSSCSPNQILTLLRTLDRVSEVEKKEFDKNLILKITYTPVIPNFTIRDILATITSIDPNFRPSIYHPQTLEERSQKMRAREQYRILIRALLNMVVAIPTFIIGIMYMSLVPKRNHTKIYLMKPFKAGVSRAQWALFIMATPVYFFCADVFHTRALKEIKASWRPRSTKPILNRFLRFGSMDLLISLGTSIAYISSLVQLVIDEVQSPTDTDNNLFYFDSVVFLTLFLLIGRLLEMHTKSRTGDTVMMLGKLRPKKTTLVEFKSNNFYDPSQEQRENIKVIDVDLLEYGEVVRVVHGESPPCDGGILFGESRFDESSLTGESALIKKGVGDNVYSGTLNKGSTVLVSVTSIANSSMLDQILRVVKEGQTKCAPIERIADKLTSIFVPIITLIAVVTWLIWFTTALLGLLPAGYFRSKPDQQVLWSLQFAISVFIVACPCGLALAAPTALFVGIGIAANHGILAKGGGEAFEKGSKLGCIVFDKTGTLTFGGEPTVTDHKIFSQDKEEIESERYILGVVRTVEQNSSHPIAKALASFCRRKNCEEVKLEALEEVDGKGMKGLINRANDEQKVEVLVGNEFFISDHKLEIDDIVKNTLERWKSEGKSIALIALKAQAEKVWQLAAIFSISDSIRPEAYGVIKILEDRGVEIWMLSGDNQITANAVGKLIGIPTSNIIAGVLPSQKAEKIQELQRSLKFQNVQEEHSQKRVLVAMVGDGINDSPALITADVGIAIGSGSDIAISSADFVIMSSNLKAVITIFELSQSIFRRIKYNFGWAMIYNMIALPVAAGSLYPITQHGTHVRLDPVWASLAMATSSISVICSSLLLRSKIPGLGFRVSSGKVNSSHNRRRFKFSYRWKKNHMYPSKIFEV